MTMVTSPWLSGNGALQPFQGASQLVFCKSARIGPVRGSGIGGFISSIGADYLPAAAVGEAVV